MAIKANFNLDEVFGKIYKQFQEQIIPSLIEQVESVCIDVVTKAKQLDTYKDRTGNLRSSLGYVIYREGQKVKEFFEAKPGTESGQDGTKAGSEIANNAAKTWPTGIVAVIVAGMDYALYVESKGYDVITGPAQQLNALLKERLQDIKDVYK